MAKNVFFSEDTLNAVGQLVETEHGRTVIDYGKGNFLLGGLTAVAYGMMGYGVYKAAQLGVLIYKYLKS